MAIVYTVARWLAVSLLRSLVNTRMIDNQRQGDHFRRRLAKVHENVCRGVGLGNFPKLMTR